MCLVSSGVVARRCVEPTIRDLLTIPDAVETMLFKFNWGNAMAAVTPFLVGQEQLAALGSRYVETNDLPWKPTPTPGIDMKILLEDKESGLLTALFRWEPGTQLPLHEHIEIEQTYVLDGSIVDDEGEVRAGNYVWRPKGNRHLARSPNGALVISFFLKPNKFLASEE